MPPTTDPALVYPQLRPSDLEIPAHMARPLFEGAPPGTPIVIYVRGGDTAVDPAGGDVAAEAIRNLDALDAGYREFDLQGAHVIEFVGKGATERMLSACGLELFHRLAASRELIVAIPHHGRCLVAAVGPLAQVVVPWMAGAAYEAAAKQGRAAGALTPVTYRVVDGKLLGPLKPAAETPPKAAPAAPAASSRRDFAAEEAEIQQDRKAGLLVSGQVRRHALTAPAETWAALTGPDAKGWLTRVTEEARKAARFTRGGTSEAACHEPMFMPADNGRVIHSCEHHDMIVLDFSGYLPWHVLTRHRETGAFRYLGYEEDESSVHLQLFAWEGGKLAHPVRTERIPRADDLTVTLETLSRWLVSPAAQTRPEPAPEPVQRPVSIAEDPAAPLTISAPSSGRSNGWIAPAVVAVVAVGVLALLMWG